ncbi:MAG: 2-amino-4-hydroxy-6-hydroxymethyldihydropteridine diphosphokinase [Hespellia sp.]|nr:2-amino-4-hydroxy-6-hydroxymethyldihydropteridine diphosphokinase [Hespellia sp.]
MDKIKIENLQVFAKHGVFPEENVLGQKFLISAILYTDTRKAGKTDDLTASIHYGEVSKFIYNYMQGHTYQLLERVAESLAEELLLHTPHLEKVQIEVKKPWAPVGLPLDTVAVQIERAWHTAYIALGSNMGNEKAYLDDAVRALGQISGCEITKVSSFLVTPPYGMVEQDDFLNGCLELRTLLTPEELLEELHKIEQSAGRERVVHWGPRTLDLDIIFYDDIFYQSEALCIPHVEMHKRKFVLEPLKEIAPYMRHPATGKTVTEMLDELEFFLCES